MVNGLISRPEKVRLLKVLSADSGEWFIYTGSPVDFDDKKFTILNMDDSICADDLVSGDDYKPLFLIKDGGSFDLDGQENGSVFDPMALVEVPVTGVTISSQSITLPIGDSYDLKSGVEIVPSIADNPAVTWSSDNPSMVSVSDGTATGVSRHPL